MSAYDPTKPLDRNSSEELGCVLAGFSLEKAVPAHDSKCEYVRVNAPNSLLHFRFTTLDHNIGFSIEKVGKIKLQNGER